MPALTGVRTYNLECAGRCSDQLTTRPAFTGCECWGLKKLGRSPAPAALMDGMKRTEAAGAWGADAVGWSAAVSAGTPPPRPPALPGEGAGGVLSLRVSGHGACCADRGHRPTSGAAQP